MGTSVGVTRAVSDNSHCQQAHVATSGRICVSSVLSPRSVSRKPHTTKIRSLPYQPSSSATYLTSQLEVVRVRPRSEIVCHRHCMLSVSSWYSLCVANSHKLCWMIIYLSSSFFLLYSCLHHRSLHDALSV